MSTQAQIVLGPGNEECASGRYATQATEVHVAAVHNIEGSWLYEQLVEPKNIVLASIEDFSRPSILQTCNTTVYSLGFETVNGLDESLNFGQ